MKRNVHWFLTAALSLSFLFGSCYYRDDNRQHDTINQKKGQEDDAGGGNTPDPSNTPGSTPPSQVYSDSAK